MKVVHIAPSYCRRDGGPSEVLRGLLPVLEGLGIDITLVTSDKGLESDERENPPIANTRILRHIGPYSLTFVPRLVAAVRDVVLDADIVHVHGVDNWVSLVGMREAIRAGKPLVIQPHGAWDGYIRASGRFRKRVWGVALQDRLARRATAVVVSSTLERDDARDAFPEPATWVVPLGVDESLLSVATPWGERSGALVLGRIAAKKRVDLAIEAFAAAARSGAQDGLTIAGAVDPDLPFDLEEVLSASGLRDRIDWRGPVGPEERRQLLATSRAFLAPSDDESFGIAVAEAAAAGMAVVGTRHVGALADAEAAGAARTVAQTVEALGTATLSALEDAAEVDAHRLRDYARATWTWSRAGSVLATAYEETRA